MIIDSLTICNGQEWTLKPGRISARTMLTVIGYDPFALQVHVERSPIPYHDNGAKGAVVEIFSVLRLLDNYLPGPQLTREEHLARHSANFDLSAHWCVFCYSPFQPGDYVGIQTPGLEGVAYLSGRTISNRPAWQDPTAEEEHCWTGHLWQEGSPTERMTEVYEAGFRALSQAEVERVLSMKSGNPCRVYTSGGVVERIKESWPALPSSTTIELFPMAYLEWVQQLYSRAPRV